MRKSFTLIEVIVVIAIVAILAGLLFQIAYRSRRPEKAILPIYSGLQVRRVLDIPSELNLAIYVIPDPSQNVEYILIRDVGIITRPLSSQQLLEQPSNRK